MWLRMLLSISLIEANMCSNAMHIGHFVRDLLKNYIIDYNRIATWILIQIYV